ncbi:hypothetical protein [Sphaerisporangium sp. TRM90804]|nr:hypothetical protein [Sphaerisporangium sp. TRM90804]MDH2426152.1 hypothetical protein [Sphaerisporangium sp. TRM90804]
MHAALAARPGFISADAISSAIVNPDFSGSIAFGDAPRVAGTTWD